MDYGLPCPQVIYSLETWRPFSGSDAHSVIRFSVPAPIPLAWSSGDLPITQHQHMWVVEPEG